MTANAARPIPQGSYHYGTIPINRTLVLANAATMIYGKLRYTVNRISYINPTTPLKLADWYNISGVFDFKTILSTPTIGPAHFGTSVFDIELHEFVEIVFQNDERSILRSKIEGTSGSYPFENLRTAADKLFLHGSSDLVVAKQAIVSFSHHLIHITLIYLLSITLSTPSYVFLLCWLP